ncbi:dioxygenase family protein [Chryseolinea lacunae]|uniref:Intradiol ring-cleavage dioxygenase n=1 Tax=Chryseolinea lacunae TaxID=2801331 RepID=A0ABS1KX03_9BACT|nr:intradiol ring-cleavage dioxygenase [Chryseolinea lacunae]MBL0743934.1 intradiol ring-cleavage dioxygenase [Chryseolinea lacunae]
MERKEFLKSLGFTGFMVPLIASCREEDVTATDPTDTDNTTSGDCTVTDTETDGPYPLYASRGSSIQRVDITDGKTGLQLDMTLVVKNVNDSCNVLANARVDIWHCDKDGYYSGYSNSGYLGTQNNSALVFCRGLQYANDKGEVTFKTIYPGWYTGRVTHIHVQVYVGTSLKLTSQIAFPEDINTEVYKTSLYSAHGQNSTKNTSDSIIKDSLDNELATVVANAATGGYTLTHTIFVSA